MVNHFINFKHLKTEQLEAIIARALEIKRNPAAYAQKLSGKKMYMLFQKTSTRTALSFALGMTGLGGEYFLQNWEDSNFAVGEIRDEVRYVARHVDVIMARLKNNSDINLMSEYSPVPVVNGCCNKYHPCQAVADLLTIKEIFGNFKVKLLYLGIRNNVLNSLMESLPRLGGELFAVTPVINQPSIDEELYKNAEETGKFHDIKAGNPDDDHFRNVLKEMDIVYTDTWIDMEFVNDPAYDKEKNKRLEKMLPFQVNSELLKGGNAVVMHDMPIHSGSEISRDMVEKNIDIILRQAENRQYAEQAILLSLLGKS
jgi:ornithine carbamoyltransferase